MKLIYSKMVNIQHSVEELTHTFKEMQKTLEEGKKLLEEEMGKEWNNFSGEKVVITRDLAFKLTQLKFKTLFKLTCDFPINVGQCPSCMDLMFISGNPKKWCEEKNCKWGLNYGYCTDTDTKNIFYKEYCYYLEKLKQILCTVLT